MLFAFAFLFTQTNLKACDADFRFSTSGLMVQFDDRSVLTNAGIGGINYNWDFGDGNTSTGPSPMHAYTTGGNFQVQLIIGQTGNVSCLDTITKQVQVCAGCVWPGDADNDGVVDNNDVLAIGLAFGSLGPVRSDTSTNFAPKPAIDFASIPNSTFSDGTNFRHADSDGDGVVDAFDLRAISKNYGKTIFNSFEDNDFGNYTNGDVRVFLEILEDSVPVGSSVSYKILVEENGQPVQNMYGIAFSLEYDPALVDSGSASISYATTDIGSPADLLELSKDLYGQEEIQSGITRTDQTDAQIVSEVGTVSFVMEDNLAQKDGVISQYLYLRINNVLLIDAAENEIQTRGSIDSVLVYEVVSSSPILPIKKGQARINIYPNPTNGSVIVSATEPIETYSIIDPLGRQWLSHTFQKPIMKTSLDLIELPSGVYYLLVNQHNDRKVMQKIVKR